MIEVGVGEYEDGSGTCVLGYLVLVRYPIGLKGGGLALVGPTLDPVVVRPSGNRR